jgi:hypothetical protein
MAFGGANVVLADLSGRIEGGAEYTRADHRFHLDDGRIGELGGQALRLADDVEDVEEPASHVMATPRSGPEMTTISGDPVQEHHDRRRHS